MTDIRSSSPLAEPSKVAAVTFGFWIIKVLATTLGETGGDWVSMALNPGYLIVSAIFAVFLDGGYAPAAALVGRDARVGSDRGTCRRTVRARAR